MFYQNYDNYVTITTNEINVCIDVLPKVCEVYPLLTMLQKNIYTLTSQLFEQIIQQVHALLQVYMLSTEDLETQRW